MSSYLYRLGRLVTRHRRWVLLGWLAGVVLLLGAVAVGGGKLTDDLSIPATESQAGIDTLAARFPEVAGASGQVLFHATDPIGAHEQQVKAVIADLRKVAQVEAVNDPFDTTSATSATTSDGASLWLSKDGHYALANLGMSVPTEALDPATLPALEQVLADIPADSGLRATLGGPMLAQRSVHISGTEGLGVLLAAAVLALTFGSLLAAGMPLLSAVLGVVVSMLGIMLAAAVVGISTTTPTLALMIGLAVGIDYALFLLSRHRTQLADGMPVVESIARTVATAGGAVVFAGATVIIGLLGLAVAQIPFLAVMGAAAAATVAVAVAVALTALPALLAVAGERLRPQPRRLVGRGQGLRLAERWIDLVMRWPKTVVAIVIAALGLLAVPAAGLALGLPDNGAAAAGSSARVTYDDVAAHFGPGFNAPILVSADIITTTDPLGVMAKLSQELAAVPGVHAVGLATPNRGGDLGIAMLIPQTAQAEPATAQLVTELRRRAPEWAADLGISDVTVTGHTAVTVDVSARLGAALLPFGLVVVGLSLVLLTAVFRAIPVPIKATLGYLLSVAAAFGVVTLVFIEGHATGLLNVAVVGPVVAFLPIILMGVLFGLSMDYEVFLVSRIREDYVHGGDARAAVRSGFIASARVVSAAALIMVAVFAAFVPTGDDIVKPIAFGLAVGVAVDAFAVRMTLVPAVMTLLGERAWWLPSWLDRVLPDLDVEGAHLVAHLEHEQWEAEHGPAAVRAVGVGLDGPAGMPLWEPFDLVVRPGTVAVVETAATPEPELAAAALVALLRGSLAAAPTGTLVVCELMLPAQAAEVRTRVWSALDPELAARTLRAAAIDPGDTGLIALVAPANDLWELLDLAADLVAAHPQLAVVIALAKQSALDLRAEPITYLALSAPPASGVERPAELLHPIGRNL